jgi:hypothetical protein
LSLVIVLAGNRVLEPSGTNTNDRNGNQRFEKNRRDFEGAFVSKVSKTSFFSGSLVRNESASHRIKSI